MERPHRRFNSLTGDWVLVSPHRTKRPWQGKVEPATPHQGAKHDPQCYLCPGNERAGGVKNPNYEGTFVFENDFAALLPELAPDRGDVSGNAAHLLMSSPVRGECRVMCFSPWHDLSLARMEVSALRHVIDTWAAQLTELGQRYPWVQIFENKGDVMGCSNPHPHGQIWASDFLPDEVSKEEAAQAEWFWQNKSVLLLDYACLEAKKRERVILQNEHWLAVVPWWAVWPYEVLLMPHARHIPRLDDLRDEERDALSQMIKQLLTRYDNLFQTSFPYSMGWHGAPHVAGTEAHWQVHAHFYPPLLRSASVKKFMVGYEMLGEPQRDMTAESAAEKLRACSDFHYLDHAS